MIDTEMASLAESLWITGQPHDPDPVSPNQDPAQHTSFANALRILVVEDEFFIALDMQEQIERLGYVVAGIALSADEAIAMTGDVQPDVVLMDIRLAGIRDGIEAAIEIQNRFGTSIIFVTANSDSGTRQRAEAIRPLAFLEKPLTEDRLQQALARLKR